MKICFCVDTMNSGGAERVAATLSNQFVQMNYEITVVMIAANVTQSFYELDSRIKLIALCEGNKNRVKAFKRLKLLKECLKNEKPDVIISFLPNANVYTSFAARKLHIPHIVSERNNPYVDPRNKLMRLLKERAFKKADGCVFQTNDAKRYYSLKVQSKSIVIYNPISLNADFGCAQRKNCVLSVGRLTEQKNIGLLLNAFCEFHKTHSDYKLLVYGDGQAKQSLIKLADDLNISSFVEFKGNSKTWHKEAGDAKMFILSSDYEGMPNALMEAMALGIPSISTDCPIGGPKELIRNGENGFLIPLGDCGALVKRMCEIADSEILAESVSKANINLRKDLSAEKICLQWAEFIQKVIC